MSGCITDIDGAQFGVKKKLKNRGVYMLSSP